MTNIKERGQFVLDGGQALADAANTDPKGIARFTGLSEKAVSTVLSGRRTTWIRCAKVARALNALGASDASDSAVRRVDA